MKNVLILGAAGGIARVAIDLFLKDTDASLTLDLRDSRRLKGLESVRVRVVDGDVLDVAKLKEAMTGQDFVYADLSGDLFRVARTIVHAVGEAGVRRFVFISSMGIYGEVLGEKYRSVLDLYRDSAKVVEESDLDYTILRPGWFTDDDKNDDETTQKGEPFRGHDVSRKSVASLVVKFAQNPGLELRKSLGVSKV